MDLSLAPIDDLVNELLNRCDHGAIVLMRCNESGPNFHTYVRRWKGNTHVCVGLCQDMADTVLQDYRTRKSTPIPENLG